MVPFLLHMPQALTAWLPYALGAFAAFWALTAALSRAGRLARDTAHTLQLAALVLLYEGLRRGLRLPACLAPWLLTLELALLACLTVQAVVKLFMGRYLEQHRHRETARILRDLAALLIVALFALVFLRLVLHVNLAAILTPSAILTAIVGLSLQDTIGNFFAGLVLQFEQPFAVNDWVEVDGRRGQVREMTWRYTKIETAEKIYLVIPNSRIAAETIVNLSKPAPVVREFLTIGVSYGTPPLKVKQAIAAVLQSATRVIRKEAAEILLHAYEESSIQYRIGYFIADPGEHRQARDEVYSGIWYQFRKQGIDIPFPIRTLVMKTPDPEPDVAGPARQLAALPLFAGLQAESLAALVRFGLVQTVAPGREIVRDGEPGETMFFILEGDFEVRKDGRPLATLRPGDLFGEMSLLTGAPRSATIAAAAPGRLLEIDRSAFKVLLDTEPRLLAAIERVCGERTRAAAGAVAGRPAAADARASLFQRFKQRFGLA